MTQYELRIAEWKAGELTLPSVTMGDKPVNYFAYAIAVHIFECKCMARGMTIRGRKLRDFKEYYGIKGRSAKDILPKLEQIKTEAKWKNI